jgi:hypothetical protein
MVAMLDHDALMQGFVAIASTNSQHEAACVLARPPEIGLIVRGVFRAGYIVTILH